MAPEYYMPRSSEKQMVGEPYAKYKAYLAVFCSGDVLHPS
jgi:hypothetical protein